MARWGVSRTRSDEGFQGVLTTLPGRVPCPALITRAPSPDDERSTLVALTAAGRARFARVLPGHVQVTSQMLFAPLTAGDLRQLTDIMTQARDHMRAQPPRSAAPRKSRRAADEVPGMSPADEDLSL
jgi:hypothetical protein